MGDQRRLLQNTWMNQYLVPHEYGFFGFAVAKSIRTKRNLDSVITQLQDMVKSDIRRTAMSFEHRKDSQSWQNLHGNDILSFFYDDTGLTTKQGIERTRMIRDVYPTIDKLKRIAIPGPNGTQIYILSKEDHVELFNQQLRSRVEERAPVIENISLMREHRRNLLKRSDLKLETRRQLQRLSNWMGPGEIPLEIELQRKKVKKSFKFHPTYFTS